MADEVGTRREGNERTQWRLCSSQIRRAAFSKPHFSADFPRIFRGISQDFNDVIKLTIPQKICGKIPHFTSESLGKLRSTFVEKFRTSTAKFCGILLPSFFFKSADFPPRNSSEFPRIYHTFFTREVQDAYVSPVIFYV